MRLLRSELLTPFLRLAPPTPLLRLEPLTSPLRSESLTSLLRPDPPTLLLRSEPPTSLLRLEPPTPLLRSEPLTPLLRAGPSTPLLLGLRQTLYTPPAPHTGSTPSMPHRGTPTSARRPNSSLSPPAATCRHQRKTYRPPEQAHRTLLTLRPLPHHRWHLPLRDFLTSARTPHRRHPPGPQRPQVDWVQLTYWKTYRLHLHRGRFTNPTRSTPPS